MYETERKDNKEDIAFITLARSLVTFENFSKEMKKIEATRKAGWRRLVSPKSAFSRPLAFSAPLVAFSAALGICPRPRGVLKSGFLPFKVKRPFKLTLKT